MVKFLQAGKKVKILNFIGWFCLKDKLLEKILTQQFLVLTLKGYEKFQQNLNRGFQVSIPKNGEISSSRQEGKNFKFYWLVLSKR